MARLVNCIFGREFEVPDNEVEKYLRRGHTLAADPAKEKRPAAPKKRRKKKTGV